MYCGLFEMNCWSKRSAQIAKGEFLEVPINLEATTMKNNKQNCTRNETQNETQNQNKKTNEAKPSSKDCR